MENGEFAPGTTTMRLANKTIVIIGGTSGIGLSAAKAFVREGAKVIAVGRDPAKVSAAQKELGDSAATLVGDAVEPNTASSAIEKALQSFGGFNGLYHVAGGSGRKHGDGPLHEISDEGWGYTMDENVTSLLYSNRAAVKQLLKQRAGGTILNMSSVLAFSPSPKFFGTHAYATTKAAAIGLTTSAAAYYAPRNIRFNVIAPALVATPMSERAQSDEAILQFIKTKQPLAGGRIGQASDLDSAAVFFMSDESKFVTGQVLSVDGGWCVSEGQFRV
jgi:NAD(P)-dependent dehydrogenase (short-subunit alcohol dehydrogenase family)